MIVNKCKKKIPFFLAIWPVGEVVPEGWTWDFNTFWKEEGGEKWPVAGATAKNSLEGASSRRVLMGPAGPGKGSGLTGARVSALG